MGRPAGTDRSPIRTRGRHRRGSPPAPPGVGRSYSALPDGWAQAPGRTRWPGRCGVRGSADAAYQPFDLWGQRGWPQQEVVGESHYAEDIRSLFGDRLTAAGMELYLPAQLIPEPDNRYDPNAVSVRINGRRVGYLPREEAARYAGVLSALLERGLLPQVEARVWGGVRTEYEDDGRGRERERSFFVGSVELDLAQPRLLAPTNRPPDPPYAMLPYGNAIQVTGE